jgi:hypothetical protein
VAQLLAPGLCWADTADGWGVRLMPTLWLADTRGDAVVRGTASSSDIDFEDVLEDLELGFLGAAEARKGDLALILFAMYVDVGEEIKWKRGPIGGRIDVDLRTAILDGVVAYRVFSSSSDCCGILRRFNSELLAGVRYTYLKLELDPSSISGVGDSKSWADPLVGTRLTLETSYDLSITLRFDAGGFGVGSDRTWRMTSILLYPLSERVSVAAGYQIISYDYDDGSGQDRFEFDAKLRGPFLGITVAY